MTGFQFEPNPDIRAARSGQDFDPLPPRISMGHRWLSDAEFEQLEAEMTPVLVKNMRRVAEKVVGHGGMDLLMDWRMIDCLRNGLPLDMTVYDAAVLSVNAPLSEWSVANGSKPIEVPDFTAGSWKTNSPQFDITFSKGGGSTAVQPMKSVQSRKIAAVS